MPIPQHLTSTYGKIIGHMRNQGISNEESKKKADKAIEDMMAKQHSKMGMGPKKRKHAMMEEE